MGSGVNDHLPGARVSDDGWHWWDGSTWVQFAHQRLDLAGTQGLHDEIRRGEVDDALEQVEAPDTGGVVYMRDDGSGHNPELASYMAAKSLKAAPGQSAGWVLALSPLLVTASLYLMVAHPGMLSCLALLFAHLTPAAVLHIDVHQTRQSRAGSDDYGRGYVVTHLFVGVAAVPAYLFLRARNAGGTYVAFLVWFVTAASVIACAYMALNGSPSGVAPVDGWLDFKNGALAPPISG